MKVIIIGGGIGGLATSIALRRVGIQSEVYEQAEQLREIGAGLTFWTSGLNALASLGVVDAAVAAGSIVGRFEQRTWRGEVLSVVPWSELGGESGGPSAICVRRRDLLNQLARLVDPKSVHCRHRCLAFEEGAQGVTVRFQNGAEARGDFLIGADGLHSVIRAALHGESKPRYAGYTCWRGISHYDGGALPVGTAFEAWGRGKRFATHHIGHGELFWYGTTNCPEGGADGPSGRKADVVECFKEWASPIPEIIAATNESILRNDIVDRKPIRNWGRGRITLLGDAAHPTTPNLGHGACMALQDAVVLADCFRHASSPEEALRSYERTRQPKTAAIVNQSLFFGVLGQFESRMLCGLMIALARLTPPRLGLKLLAPILNQTVPTLP